MAKRHRCGTDIPAGLTKEAREERKRFERAYLKLLEEPGEISLSILVWGQNPKKKTAASNKRRQIRDELLRRGHNAMFSEEISITSGNLSEKSKEFAQACAAHLVIILVEDAPGALAEFHDFCDHPKIAPKLYVIVPDKYKDGYSGQGALKDLEAAYGGVYWYQDSEMTDCDLLQRTTDRAEALRHIIYRHGSIFK